MLLSFLKRHIKFAGLLLLVSCSQFSFNNQNVLDSKASDKKNTKIAENNNFYVEYFPEESHFDLACEIESKIKAGQEIKKYIIEDKKFKDLESCQKDIAEMQKDFRLIVIENFILHNTEFKKYKSALFKKEVVLGMPTSVVRLSLGKPDSIKEVMLHEKKKVIWSYKSRKIIFENNLVIAQEV